MSFLFVEFLLSETLPQKHKNQEYLHVGDL
jgi:hypothetical protein